MTTELKKIIRRKTRTYNKAQRTNSRNDWAKFRRTRNLVTLQVRMARDTHRNQLIDKLKRDHPSSRSWWQISNQLTGMKQRQGGIPPLLTDNGVVTDETAKADIFNDFFVLQTELDDSNSQLPEPNVEGVEINDII